jgi:predicted nucleic acid-binding Zn finger protein
VKKDSANLDAVVSGRGVKLHYFEPSKRKIWTVVGKDNEHWLDPEAGFCSCEDYFFNIMEKGGECYHLKSVRVAKEQNKVEVIKFSDSEYENFISAVLFDL